MPLLHGKQITNASIILNKLSGTGSLVLQTGATFQVPLANIVNPTDIVNKQYVDAITTGMNPHAAVRTATSFNISLSTATVSPFISGVTLSTNDRVLVWQQTVTASNGIYYYNGSTFSRALDQDGAPAQEVAVGDYTFVIAGSYSGNGYVIVASGTYSSVLEPIDVAPIVWSQFTGPGQFTWGNGLINNGSNLISVNLAGGSGLTFSAAALTINSTIAGNGLAWSSGVLSVNTANGIAISGGNVQLASTVAGTGLTYPGVGVISIANTAVTANTYGNATTVPSVTFNAQGQAIAATAVSIQIPSGQVTNFTSSVTGLVTAGPRITITNTGGAATVSLTPLGSTSSYGAANTINTFTINNYGEVTTVATVSISIPSGQVTNFTASVQSLATTTTVNAGPGISVTQTGASATVSLTALGVTSSFGSANTINTFTYNNYGQITTAATVSIAIPSGQVTNFTSSVNSVAISSGNFTNSTTINHTVAGGSVSAVVNAGSLTASLLNTGGAGATSGYVLSVNGGGVFNWIPAASGAVTSVNAGPGISVVSTVGSYTVSLSALGVTSSIGSANTINTITYNNYGQITTSATVSIAIPSGQVTNFTSSVTGLVTAGTGITVTNAGGSATVSLTALGVTSSIGSANTINTITYNNYGQITTSATVSIAIPSGQVSNFTASVQALATTTTVNAGPGISVTQTGGSATVSLSALGVTSSIGSANTINTITYNNYGQITTSATVSIAIPSGQVTNFTSSVTGLVTAGTGITVTNAGGSATVSITNTAVTANTYGNANTIPSVTFNAQGQAIAATAVSVSITSGQVTNFTSSVSSLIVGSFGTPFYTQRNLAPVATTGNGASSSLTLTATPKNVVNVSVYVNGQLQFLGNGTTASVDCYFGTQSATARNISALTSGDTLFWNGTYVGFDLSTTDKIDILYNS